MKAVSINNIERVANNGGDIKKTLNAAQDSSKNINWLEEGISTGTRGDWGWKHIYDKHVTGTVKNGTLFKDVGIADDAVESTIFNTIKSPSKTKFGSNGKTCYLAEIVGQTGKLIAVIVNNTGSITTAYPKEATINGFECN